MKTGMRLTGLVASALLKSGKLAALTSKTD